MFDELTLMADAETARQALAESGAHLLFAMKACAFGHVLKQLSDSVDGFHASSLFEAKLARETLGWRGLIHVTTPAITSDEIDELCAVSDMISLNSLTQWDRFRAHGDENVQLGLRVNPDLSMIQDERYDPCRRHSKLGAPIRDVREVMLNDPGRLEGLKGLLVHSNSESDDFGEVLATVRHLDRLLAPLLEQAEWINLGGGYMFRNGNDYSALNEAVLLLRNKYNLRVYMEPGTSIVKGAGRLVASVLDIFPSEGKSVAILDASVNHTPEVFEFQFEADVEGETARGGHSYILGGATCLAGDIFGEFRFPGPLVPGSRVVLKNAGAYTMVKAHMFNGVNLPSVYWQAADGTCDLVKSYDFDNFKSRCGIRTDENSRS
ncbi:type III PLP-dependent enzyme domain-containing protein [Arenibacterium sp. CAU 1754]